tara:strand:- start:301 stop:2145 length:1845 start_codon:yes stop_codon:yes gene_type:complete
MTVVSNKNTPRNTYTASANQTSFAIGFEFYQIADVKVYKNGTLLTYNATPSGSSQYSITGTASASDNAYEFGAGGSITLGAGASANDIIVIIRDISVERTTDFPNSGAFDITSLNTQLDTLTSIVADVKTQTDRSVKLLDTDTVSATVTLPAKATRQSKLMGFDANGNIETTVNSAGLATISSLTTEIQALGAISSDLTNLNSNLSTISTVNTNLSTITNVNSNLSAISTVNSNISAITTANSNNTAITNVSNAIANVNQVASNLSAVNDFANIYLGASSSAPTQDPDGSALDDGDLYFDSTSNQLKVFATGSGWQNAGSSVNGTSKRYKFTISGTPTTLSGNDDNSESLTYDAGFIDVYKNGVKMVNGADVTVTSGSSIVFASALANGDIVEAIAFGTFNVSNVSAGNITSGILSTARGGTGLSSLGSAGQALVVNNAGNGLVYSNASSAEVYGFKKTFTASTLNRTVTVVSVSGSNKYFIDGVQQDTLELLEGNTYVFTYPSGHPFKFSTTSDGTHSSGSEYTTGVTHNSSTQVTIVVATNAPTLYYYCSSHAGMGGQANTPVPSNNTLQVQTTNTGADNISESDYAGFDDVLFAASGFSWSLSNGKLIATI